jgi:hypothetical protein
MTIRDATSKTVNISSCLGLVISTDSLLTLCVHRQQLCSRLFLPDCVESPFLVKCILTCSDRKWKLKECEFARPNVEVQGRREAVVTIITVVVVVLLRAAGNSEPANTGTA